jgi:hypothetical protein
MAGAGHCFKEHGEIIPYCLFRALELGIFHPYCSAEADASISPEDLVDSIQKHSFLVFLLDDSSLFGAGQVIWTFEITSTISLASSVVRTR